MPVDPELQVLLTLMSGADPIKLDGPEAAGPLREMMNGLNSLLGAGPSSVSTEDHAAPGPLGEVPIRIYRPHGVERPPVVVYIHGGGFVLGNVEGSDRDCRLLAEGAGCLVASVEYRLAPEHPFPAASDDCVAAIRWVAENAGALGADPTRLAIGGDSAGGNLAAVTALRARDEGGPSICFQLLIYPVVDQTSTMDDPHFASLTENSDGYMLDGSMMEWFRRCYVPDPSDRANPYVSPLLASSHVGLPPALVMTCEYDPLRDEGEAYAKRLADAGVEVTLSRYDGGLHGIFSMSQVCGIGRRFMDEATAALRAAFA